MKEHIQIKTDKYGWETLCEVSEDFEKIGGKSRKAHMILTSLESFYKNDRFRVVTY